MSGGRELLIALKASAISNAPCLSIPVSSPPEALLRPVVTAAGKTNPDDVRVLTEWRNRFVKSFLTEFEANESRTEQWLTNVVGPDPTKILFMLDDARGQTVGYLGLGFIEWNQLAGEADALVRGVEGAPGLMTRAFFTLLNWGYDQLGLTRLRGRVRSDNPALKFFLKAARETKRVPLRRIDEPDMIRWVEDPSLGAVEAASPSVVYLTFQRHLLRVV